MKTIEWKVENDMGHLVMNQPPANIMTPLFFEDLHELTTGIIPQSSIRALIIYGRGRHFSSGADHPELSSRISGSMDRGSEVPVFIRRTMECFLFLSELEIPTIAAIRGTCLGSALELALACRYRICAEGTVFGLPETTFGLMPGCGGTWALPKITGLPGAIDIIISGKTFSASEAIQWGIVHSVAAKSELLETAVKFAEMVKAVKE